MKWLAKACLQAALAALPWGERLNHQLQRINARRRGPGILDGRLAEITTALGTLERHCDLSGAVVVEVGTGWDALPTLALSKAGAVVHTYDHERHLRPDLFRDAAKAIGHPAAAHDDLASALRAAEITYTAPGDASRTGLPDRSVDVVFSLAVLEHVPEKALEAILTEARRILKPDGVFYALIGLHDHFNGFDRRVSKVNFLRYPEWLWSLLSKNRIAYHNRMRQSDFLNVLSHWNVLEVVPTVKAEDLQAVQTMKLAPEFRGYDRVDLATTKCEIACRLAAYPDESSMAACPLAVRPPG